MTDLDGAVSCPGFVKRSLSWAPPAETPTKRDSPFASDRTRVASITRVDDLS
jgi:hypothetical protein